MADENQSLQDIEAELLDRFDQLRKICDDTDDPSLRQTLRREMQEVLHRATMAQSLLFAQQAAGLADRADEVRAASEQAATVIKGIQDAQAVMDAVGEFLKVVDTALDFAKSLAL